MISVASDARVAVVVGGSGGIGSAIARRLSTSGLHLVVTYATNQAGGEGVIDEIQEAGGRGLALQANVAEAQNVAVAFDAAEEAFGGIDVVVHTACRVAPTPLVELDLDDLDSQYRTNIRGAFAVVQQALRRLRDGGSLITISSGVVGSYPPTWGVYTASKAALEALTLVAAKEVRGRNITVNAVAPGPTATESFVKAAPAERIEHLAKRSLLGRIGRPEEIAEVVAFLTSPQGHWINGQIIRADGGFL
jgi:3-oxoacyl-[acyl-carrier protein] reductase